MTRREIIRDFAAKYNYTQDSIAEMYDQICEWMCEKLAAGEEINMHGYIHIFMRRRKPRIGRNPRTMEEYPITEVDIPTAKFGNVLKRAVVKDFDD